MVLEEGIMKASFTEIERIKEEALSKNPRKAAKAVDAIFTLSKNIYDYSIKMEVANILKEIELKSPNPVISKKAGKLGRIVAKIE